MKKISIYLLAFLLVAAVGSCTKIQESPEPSSSNNSGGSGGGGNQGNPAVYQGLWRLDKRKLGGSEIPIDSVYNVQLQGGGMAVWTFFDAGGNIKSSQNDIYVLVTSSNPATITFTNFGVREIVTKTGSSIVWKYADPNLGGIEIEETLLKQ